MSLFMWLERSKFLKDGFEIAFLLVSEAYFISCADQNIKKVTIYYVWLTDIVFAGGTFRSNPTFETIAEHMPWVIQRTKIFRWPLHMII